MTMLSGPEIIRQVSLGGIVITPFSEKYVGSNSYDLALGSRLLRTHDSILDPTEPSHWFPVDIPADGLVLWPGVGYLGHTEEVIRCDGFVPWVDGRSTAGRHFLQVHQTAGRGDDGWEGQFTLELLTPFKPVRVYAGLRLAQVSFFRLEGERAPYAGRYSGQRGPTPPKPLPRPDDRLVGER